MKNLISRTSLKFNNFEVFDISVLDREPESSPDSLDAIFAAGTWVHQEAVELFVEDDPEDMTMTANEELRLLTFEEFSSFRTVVTRVATYVHHKDRKPFDRERQGALLLDRLRYVDAHAVLDVDSVFPADSGAHILTVGVTSDRSDRSPFLAQRMEDIIVADVACVPYLVASAEEVEQLRVEEAVSVAY